MTGESAVLELTNLPKTVGAPTLERMVRILDALGNPQEGPGVIHIAGTNGKGSVAAMIAEMLRADGYKVGMFISPYIHSFYERIQVDGKPIPAEVLARLWERVRPLAPDAVAFEAVTAIGFLYFAEEACDYVVLETGLGGRFDATNTVKKPLLSVLTHIDLDHTEILGERIEQIAAEKCGILRKNGVAVTTPCQNPDALKVIQEHCDALDVALQIAPSAVVLREERGVLELEWEGSVYSLGMTAYYQAENAATALCAGSLLGISPDAKEQGLRLARQPGRFEWVTPGLVLDGAHNPNGIKGLCESLRRVTRPREVCVVLGMLPDKERLSALPLLAEVAEELIVVPVHTPRGDDGRPLFEEAQQYFPKVSYCDYAKKAISMTDKPVVCVCGSLYLLGEV